MNSLDMHIEYVFHQTTSTNEKYYKVDLSAPINMDIKLTAECKTHDFNTRLRKSSYRDPFDRLKKRTLF